MNSSTTRRRWSAAARFALAASLFVSCGSPAEPILAGGANPPPPSGGTGGTGSPGSGSSGTGTKDSVQVLRIDRVAGSTAGGSVVTVTGSGFSSAAQVYFGANVATTTTFVSPSTLRAKVPPSSGVGFVDVGVRQNAALSVLPTVFEYIAAPTVTYASNNFESGGLAPFQPDASANGTVGVVTEDAHSGTHSVKVTVVAPFSSGIARLVYSFAFPNPLNPPLALAGGMFQRWYMKIPAATADATINTTTCALYARTPPCGQVKLLLNRYNGSQTPTAPGWLMAGFGAEFGGRSPTFVNRRDWLVGILSGAQTQTIAADQWIEVQTQYTRKNGTGIVRVWVNGQLLVSTQDTLMGSDSPTDRLALALGIAFTQNAAGTLFLYLDDVAIADGYIDP